MRFKPSAEGMPLLLFLVGAVASVVLLLLFAYAPDLRGPVSDGGDAASRSAVGFDGLRQLMALSGIPTEVDRGAAANEKKPSLTILTPTIATSTQDWRDYDEHSAVLIILPKWITISMPLHSGWVMKAGAWGPEEIKTMLKYISTTDIKQMPGDFRGLVPTVDPDILGSPARISGRIQQLQYFPKRNKAVLFLNDPRSKRLENDGVAVLIQVRQGDKPIYILSDPDLMDNQGLADPETAQMALAIIADLRDGKGPVRMDVTLNGLGRSPNLLKAMFEPPFRGATICALLTAILMALHALARFGGVAQGGRLLARGKAALAGNTAELVRMMGREAGMAPRYVVAMRNLVLAQVATRLRGAAEQDHLLDVLEKAGNSDIVYGRLAAEASRARTGSDLLAVAARAYAWKERITREYL